MSHTTHLKAVQIRDVSALRQAVAELKSKGVKCDLVEKDRPRMFYAQQHGECDFVLKLTDAPYDVGFDRQQDGSYAPVFDEWGQHVARQLGADVNVCPMPTTPEGKAQHQIGKFMQSYAKFAAINAAVAQGYIVEGTQTDAKGNVHLVLSGM
jgi:hypothetical protein